MTEQNKMPMQPVQQAPQPIPQTTPPNMQNVPQQPHELQPVPPNMQNAPQQNTPQSLISFNTTAPEPPQQANAYQSIIDEQNAQIAALMAQNSSLNAQITQMVQSGAQFSQPQQPQQMPQVGNNWAVQPMQAGAGANTFNPPSMALDTDVSLESLAKEIGKKGV